MHHGKLGIFYGPMRGGKSLELVRHLHMYKPQFPERSVLVVKKYTLHISDGACVKSRSGATLTHDNVDLLLVVDDIAEVKKQFCTPSEPFLFVIDEAHFMPGLHEAVRHLLALGHSVFVAGLDLNWKGQRFSDDDMLSLLTLAPEINKHCPAVCAVCTSMEAVFTGKYVESSDEVIEVGDSPFAPLCRTCWEKRGEHGFKKE